MRLVLAAIMLMSGVYLSMISLSSKCYPYTPGDSVVLGVMEGCSACEYSEELLKGSGIQFRTIEADSIAPELFVNGKSLGYGTEAVEEYIR